LYESYNILHEQQQQQQPTTKNSTIR